MLTSSPPSAQRLGRDVFEPRGTWARKSLQRGLSRHSPSSEIKLRFLVEEGEQKNKRKGVKNAGGGFFLLQRFTGKGGSAERPVRGIRGEQREGSSAGLGGDKHICQRLLSTQGHLWDVPWGKGSIVIHPKISSKWGFEKIVKIGLFLKRKDQRRHNFLSSCSTNNSQGFSASKTCPQGNTGTAPL